jgi:hypothetical protein
MSTATNAISCLLSHKCGEAHLLGDLLRNALRSFEICLQIDPFSVGDDVDIRMQTFNIEALILLCSPASLASEPCQLELRSASRQGMPIFTAHLEGPVPLSLRKRSYWHVPPSDSPAFATGVEELAKSVQSRVLFNRKLHLLYPSNYFYEMTEVAKSIATEEDRTIVAEFACELARRYRKISDPTTRYWIALALGRADTAQAAALLQKLPRSDHPLELEGIRQAREMIQHDELIPKPFV